MTRRELAWACGPAVFLAVFILTSSLWLPQGIDGDTGLLIEHAVFSAILVSVVLMTRRFRDAGWRGRVGLSWLWLTGPLWLGVLSLPLALPNIAAQPGRAVLWIAAPVFIGLNEEMVFRGFLLGGLGRHLGPLGAAAVSSLVFGTVHAVNAIAGADPGFLGAQMIVAFGTGMTLSAVTLRAGSIWPAVFVHFVLDAVGLSVLGGFDAAVQSREAIPGMLILGAISSVWGWFWIRRMTRRQQLPSLSPQPSRP